MTRTLLLSLAVLGVAAALAVGSYSALAGSNPVGDAADAVVGAHGSDADDNGTDDVNDVAEDVDEDEGGEANVQGESEAGAGADQVAQAIADEFGAGQEEVLALHEQGIGFGALFKLYALARATGTTVDDLLASIDGDGYAFGKRFKELTEEQQAVLDAGPKNLGQLVSASHHPDDDGEAEASAATQALEKANGKFAANSSHGHGPPAGAPAHGHN